MQPDVFDSTHWKALQERENYEDQLLHLEEHIYNTLMKGEDLVVDGEAYATDWVLSDLMLKDEASDKFEKLIFELALNPTEESAKKLSNLIKEQTAKTAKNIAIRYI